MASNNRTLTRLRAVTRERIVPVTRNGRTHEGIETYTEYVPEPPRDWDRAFLGGVTTVAVASGLGCVAWSTTSIGSLLATIAPAPVAYGAAVAYDLLWMSCTVLEWLARYEPDQAKGPRRAGLVFLLIAMAALITEGRLSGGIAAGIFGAVLSAGVKTLWVYIGRRHARPLDSLNQQWVDAELAEAAGHLAIASVQRRLTRAAAELAAYRAAFPIGDPSGPGPDKPTGRPHGPSATERSAILAALAISPGSDPVDIVEQLARVGIDTTPDTVRTLSGQHPDKAGQTPDSRSAAIISLAPHAPDDSITDTVRGAARKHGADLEAVLSTVRRVHGPQVSRDTVRRLLARVAG